MADIYKIQVALAMSSNHNAILSALSAGLLGVHANVNQLTSGFGRLKGAIISALAVKVGDDILGTMVKLVNSTKEYSDELAKLETLGGGMAKAVTSGAISSKAFDISQRIPMRVEDLMKIPGASYSILGQEDSMAMWEKLAQFQWVMQNQNGFHGNAGDDMAKFLRSGELSGRLTDPATHKAGIEELTKFLDLSQKVMAATHGMVTPSTMLGMSQQAGFSMRGMTDEGFMNMAIMAQAMGGPRAGTAMLSLYNQVATGKMSRPAVQGMTDLGLLKESEWTSDHGHVVVDPKAEARLGKLLGKNPMDFVDQIYENLEKQGVTDPDEQKRRVANAMSRQTSERFVIEQMMNREQMAAERERMGQGAGAGAAAGIYDAKSVSANEEALMNAWHNLQVAVAGPQSENVIAVLKQLTGILNSMQLSVTGMDPKTVGIIAEGIGAISIALMGIGTVALVAFAGIPGIIIGVGLAAAALIAINWQAITSIFDSVKTAIASFIEFLMSIPGKLRGLLPDAGWGPERDESGHMKKPGVFDKYLWGDPADSAPKKNMMFNPGSSQPKATPVQLSLSVDGRVLGQTVQEILGDLMNFPSQAPTADGYSRWHDADHNLSST
jgi:hypothetical protein